MRAILRSVFALFLGIVVAALLIAATEFVSSLLYPLPSGVDPRNRSAMEKVARNLPTGALCLVLAGWAIGTFGGSWVAARIAKRWQLGHALAIGIFFLAAAVANMLMLPHPAWVWAVGISLFLPAALAGAHCATVTRES